jgi:hypothetical protein
MNKREKGYKYFVLYFPIHHYDPSISVDTFELENISNFPLKEQADARLQAMEEGKGRYYKTRANAIEDIELFIETLKRIFE